jgi:hypothetical protein
MSTNDGISAALHVSLLALARRVRTGTYSLSWTPCGGWARIRQVSIGATLVLPRDIHCLLIAKDVIVLQSECDADICHSQQCEFGTL